MTVGMAAAAVTIAPLLTVIEQIPYAGYAGAARPHDTQENLAYAPAVTSFDTARTFESRTDHAHLPAQKKRKPWDEDVLIT
jgi:hypothetical protein